MLDLIKRNSAEKGRLTTTRFASQTLPVRKGARPKTIMGPLHVQCNGHGDPKYLRQLLNDILNWPYVEPAPTSPNHLHRVSIQLQGIAATDDSSAFISATEFARVLLAVPTIILPDASDGPTMESNFRWELPSYCPSMNKFAQSDGLSIVSRYTRVVTVAIAYSSSPLRDAANEQA